MFERLQIGEKTIWWIAGASFITFLAFLILVPLLAIRIPSDYFARGKFHRKLWADQHLVLRMVLLTGKNLLGCVFIVGGIVMLVLPGQGILTILAGIMLLDFPGKVPASAVDRRSSSGASDPKLASPACGTTPTLSWRVTLIREVQYTVREKLHLTRLSTRTLGH
jgi:hypothetical protein